VGTTALSSPTLPAAKPATQFRELDLAAAAAQNDKSLLISGVSGVGKTTFIRHVIHAINREYDGSQVFVGVDFKGSTGHFCGLEKSQSFITSPAPGRDYKFAAEAVGNVVEMLGNRDEEFPLYLLVDEINNGLEQAKCQGNAYGRKPEETLKSNLKFIATQGRERNIRGILTAHGNLMGMLGIDGDTAQSLVCAVLGRKVDKGDGFALIGKVLNNQVLFSKDERQKLSAEFVRVRPMVEPTGQTIALTNIEGDWEFVLLPTSYKHDPGRLSGNLRIRALPNCLPRLTHLQPLNRKLNQW
jgi:energy-coupling factor transporter ATP-binding protein EcfA2